MGEPLRVVPDPRTRRSWQLAEMILGSDVLDVAVLGIAFPVLVTKHGCPAEERANGTAHALGAFSGPVRIGRTTENDIVLDDETISRRHATLSRDDAGQWVLVDEGSRNGTFKDQGPVSPRRPTLVKPTLERLRFGPSVRLALMDEPTFRTYVDYLRENLRRRRGRMTARLEPSAVQPSAPAPSQRWTSEAEEYQAASILDAMRTAPFPIQEYRVVLDGALVEEAEGWSELVEVVEQRVAQMIAIEARTPEGRWCAVWQRCASGKAVVRRAS
jgi:hypothetical protein